MRETETKPNVAAILKVFAVWLKGSVCTRLIHTPKGAKYCGVGTNIREEKKAVVYLGRRRRNQRRLHGIHNH